MPTLNEHAENLRKLQQDPASLGYTQRTARKVLFDYRRNLGRILVDRIAELLPIMGDDVVEDDPLSEGIFSLPPKPYPDTEPVVIPETLPPYPMIAALDRAIADGSKTIMLFDEHKSVLDSYETIDWAVKRTADLVVVVADDFMSAVIESKYEDDVLPANLRIINSTKMEKGPKDDHLDLGNVSTVLLIKPVPKLHPMLFAFAERVREEHPDAVVVYERGFGEFREMPGTDTFLRLTGKTVAIQNLTQPAPGI